MLAITAILKALQGEKVVIITTNEYLANRDCEWNRQLIEEYGLSVSYNEPIDEEGRYNEDYLKTSVYQSNIVYTTVSEFVFDFLRNREDADYVARTLKKFLIIDEIDLVLIDNSSTDFSVSTSSETVNISSEDVQLYSFINSILSNFNGAEITASLKGYKLKEDIEYDFVVQKEEKVVFLTDKGNQKIESILGFDIYKDISDVTSAVLNILQTRNGMELGKDYYIEDNKITPIDQPTGRFKIGSQYNSATTLALNIKHGLPIGEANNLGNSINGAFFFSQFKKLTGASGTVWYIRDLMWDIFSKQVIKGDRNLPKAVTDEGIYITKTYNDKINLMKQEISRLKEINLPILIVEENDIQANKLHKELNGQGIESQLLTNDNLEEEDNIISNIDGNSILVTTLISGRGTDIKIDEKLSNRGGLQVILASQFANKRTEVQIKGRTSRQGLRGSVITFSSLEDNIYKRLTINKKKKLMGMSSYKLRKVITKEQKFYQMQMSNTVKELYRVNYIKNIMNNYLIDSKEKNEIRLEKLEWVDRYTRSLQKRPVINFYRAILNVKKELKGDE